MNMSLVGSHPGEAFSLISNLPQRDCPYDFCLLLNLSKTKNISLKVVIISDFLLTFVMSLMNFSCFDFAALR